MLPTQKTPRRTSLNDVKILLYGAYKLGKSSLCAQAPKALFLSTEPGLNQLEVYQLQILSWGDLLRAAKAIAEGDGRFNPLVLDTVDNAYRMCSEHVCEQHGIKHESDLEYGKGYALVYNEFTRVLTKLAMLPYGLFLISHAQDKEIQTRTGKLTKTVPTLPDKACRFVEGMVDLTLFCDIEVGPGPDGRPTQRRVLRTKPTQLYDAGDRTGLLPESIDLDYNAFVDAYRTATQSRPAATELTAPAAPPREATAAPDAQVPSPMATAPRTGEVPRAGAPLAPTHAASPKSGARSR